MTSITKDELMQMARDAGALVITENGGRLCAGDVVFYDGDSLEKLYNSILERAAVECDATKARYKGMAEEEDKTLLKAGECSDYWRHISALAGAAYDIRALKINTVDCNE